MKLITHININSALGKGGFLRQAAAIGLGSVVGQVVLVASSLVLTRIFSPENFAVLAMFVSVVSIFFTVATGRYELAVVIPDSDKEAVNLLVLSVVLSTLVAILLTFAIFLFGNNVLEYYGFLHLKLLLWFVPLAIIVSAWRSSAMRWQTRKGRFLTLGYSKAFSSVSTAILQVTVGVFFFQAGGLILVVGNIVGRIVGLGILLRGTTSDLWNSRTDITWNRIIFVCTKYWRFPIYLGPSGLTSIAIDALPCVLIGVWFGGTTLGYYAIAERTLLMPTALIGDAIGTVFFQRVSVAKHDGVKSRILLVKLSVFLFAISVIPAIILYFFGPTLYGIAFGEQWTRSGQFASIFIFLAITKFVVWPTRMLLQAVHSQLLAFIWFVIYLILAAGSLWFGKITNSVDNAIIFYTATSSFMFIAYWVISYVVLGRVIPPITQIGENGAK